MSHKTLTWWPAAQDPFPFHVYLPYELTLYILLVSLLVLVTFPVICFPCRFLTVCMSALLYLRFSFS